MGSPKGQVRKTAYPPSDTLRQKDRPPTALWRVGLKPHRRGNPLHPTDVDGANLSGSGQSHGRMKPMRPLFFVGY
jgi:hypothetical protein